MLKAIYECRFKKDLKKQKCAVKTLQSLPLSWKY